MDATARTRRAQEGERIATLATGIFDRLPDPQEDMVLYKAACMMTELSALLLATLEEEK
jgi:hypothetical protein